jgi:transcriptional regulator with XRE-family HTH domain
MGTEVRAVPETAPLDAAETSIGRYLARQRELRGISLDELAARTKIPIRSLARLESGAFDAKPDGFARGFVRTVALALGLDADEAVTRLLAEPAAEAASADARLRPRLAIAAVVLLALVAGGAIWRSLSSRDARPAARPAPPSEWVLRPDAVRSLAAGDVPEPPPREPGRAAAAPAATAKSRPTRKPIARSEASVAATATPATGASESVAAAPVEPAPIPAQGAEPSVAVAPQPDVSATAAGADAPEVATREPANAESAPTADAIAAAPTAGEASAPSPIAPGGPAAEPAPAAAAPSEDTAPTEPAEAQSTEIGAPPPQ